MYNIVGGFGITLFASGIGLMVLSHYIKNHAEKFHSERLAFIKPKLHHILRKLYIEHIFESLNELDYLSEVAKSQKDEEAKNKLKIFKDNLIKHLTKGKALKTLRSDLESIVELFVVDTKSHSRVKDKAKNILDIVKEHDTLEKLFETAYRSEIKESTNIFKLSIGLCVLGFTIIILVLLECYEGISLGENINYFYMLLFSELYVLAIFGMNIYRNHNKKNELQNKISNMEKETLDVSAIETE